MAARTLRVVLTVFVASTPIVALKEVSDSGRSDFANKHQCIKTYAAQLDGISPGLGDDIRARRFHAGKSDQAIVLGAGMGTTATRSLEVALRILGLSGDHWGKEQWRLAWELGYANSEFNMSRCRGFLGHCFGEGTTPERWSYTKEYMMDTPVGELFVDFYAVYPKAKFILTNRPAENWVDARLNNHGDNEFAPLQEPCNQRMKNYSRHELISLFKYHAELVRCMVPKDRLLEINVWEDSKGKMDNLMEDLAKFVGKRIDISPWADVGIDATKYPHGHPHRNSASHLRLGLRSMGQLPEEACASEDYVASALRPSLSRNRVRGADSGVSSVDDPYKVPISFGQVGLLIQEAARRDCEVVVMDSGTSGTNTASVADARLQAHVHFVLQAGAP